MYSHGSFLYSHIQVLKYWKGIFLFSVRLEGVPNAYSILAYLLPCCLLVICIIGHFTTTSVVIVVLNRESKFRNMLRIKTFFFCISFLLYRLRCLQWGVKVDELNTNHNNLQELIIFKSTMLRKLWGISRGVFFGFV